jgi:SpoVK/Ycf46/Vps4 family AAA+-type ATPase
MPEYLDWDSLRREIALGVAELIPYVKLAAWDCWKAGDDAPDARGTLLADLMVLSITFASADGCIDLTEAKLFADLKYLVISGEDEYTPTVTRNVMEAVRAKHDALIEDISRLPLSIHYLDRYDQQNGTSFSSKARALFFRYASAIAKADGAVSKREQKRLAELRTVLLPNTSTEATTQLSSAAEKVASTSDGQAPNRNDPASLDEVLAKLNELVGLGTIKQEVSRLINFIKVQELRKARGLPTPSVSRHFVFLGNPGTGKTTVARLLSETYRCLGLLSKGHLVETDRSGLVAGYVGQTAIKTREVAMSALGGVLFIDEAYSLANDSNNDYGKEAIEILLKIMEDHRDELVVVVAGYTEAMQRLLLSNAGLRSRFAKILQFDDYTPEELMLIFDGLCSKHAYVATPDARNKLLQHVGAVYDMRTTSFGNGRLVRNIFETALALQADRIIALNTVSPADLTTITAQDLPSAHQLAATI